MNEQSRTITSILLSLLVCINIWLVVSDAHPWFVSSLNIFFHEAGHWVFSFFGRYITVLGGTLGELLVPSLFIYYFTQQNKLPGQIFSWWWFSIALYDISIYVADARTRQLSLIGGQGGHDWVYLLGKINMMKSDIFISQIFIITFMMVTIYMIVLIHRYYIISQKTEMSF